MNTPLTSEQVNRLASLIDELENVFLGRSNPKGYHLRRIAGQAKEAIEHLQQREKLLLDTHTGCGCDPSCPVCREKAFT